MPRFNGPFLLWHRPRDAGSPSRRLADRSIRRGAPRGVALALLAAICSFVLPARLLSQDPAAQQRVLVDDFERSGPANALGQRSGAFADPNGLGYCYVFFTVKNDQVWGNKGHSLYLKFDTSKPGAWGGYWTELGHLNLQNFRYLVFYLRGFQGAEQFAIGLRGKLDAQHETKVPIEEVLAGGVTTEWRQVRIPLKAFTAIQNWDDVNMLSFNFEYASGSRAGAIVIDEIAFER